MSHHGEGNRDLDCHETTQVRVCDVATDKGHEVRPELVESNQSSRSSLILSKCPWLNAIVWTCGTVASLVFLNIASPRSVRPWLLDEVGEQRGRTVVAESFAKFDKGDGHGLPRDGLADAAECRHLLHRRLDVAIYQCIQRAVARLHAHLFVHHAGPSGHGHGREVIAQDCGHFGREAETWELGDGISTQSRDNEQSTVVIPCELYMQRLHTAQGLAVPRDRPCHGS